MWSVTPGGRGGKPVTPGRLYCDGTAGPGGARGGCAAEAQLVPPVVEPGYDSSFAPRAADPVSGGARTDQHSQEGDSFQCEHEANCSPVDPDQANHPEQTPPGPVTDDQALDTPAPDRPRARAGRLRRVLRRGGWAWTATRRTRALFREALHAALEDGPETFVHCGYPVARKTVANIARAFYFRTNRAGVYVPVVPQGRKRPTPLQRVLAADALHRPPRAVKAALWVMEAIRIARHFRPRQRNRPAQWAINVGRLRLADRPSPRQGPSRRTVRGVASDTTGSGPWCRPVDTTEIFIGLRTGHEDQQQQQGPLPLAPVVEPEPAARTRPAAGPSTHRKATPRHRQHGRRTPPRQGEAPRPGPARFPRRGRRRVQRPEGPRSTRSVPRSGGTPQRRIGQFRGAATAAADAIRSDLDARAAGDAERPDHRAMQASRLQRVHPPDPPRPTVRSNGATSACDDPRGSRRRFQ